VESKLLLVLLDLVVLCALGGTIFYLRSVSGSIKIIREGKTELQQVLQQLNLHISNAQHAIESMNKLADSKAKILQKHSDAASSVIDELQYMQKAADNVAMRLEKLTGNTLLPKDTDEPKTPARANVSKAEKELADALAARRSKASGE
jgi:antitoxin component of RelBE/YafQ-DinJ toxin-antitoxin module